MRTLLAVTLVAGLLGAWTPVLQAQGTNMAVIDVNRVFENHARFKARMEDLQKQITSFDGELRQQQQRIKGVAEKLEQYKPGSAEYKTTEQQLAGMQADLQVRMSLKRKEFLEMEAKVYFEAYNEVVLTVSQFCERHGIGMVLRFNGMQMDPTKRESVMQGVNRAVVFQRNMDITDSVIERLNQGMAPASVGRQQSQIPVRGR